MTTAAWTCENEEFLEHTEAYFYFTLHTHIHDISP